jgi:tetratricopeptide (TPR) repeat protein
MFSKLAAFFRRPVSDRYREALADIARGHPESALTRLEELLGDASFQAVDRATLINKCGVALVDLGRKDEARVRFSQALELNARFAPALTNLGNLLLEDGRPAEALERYESALLADDDYSLAHANRAVALKRLGRHGEAVRALRRADRLQGGLLPKRRR